MKKQGANVYSTLGASNHSKGERARHDLYCTHPKAVEELLKLERFSDEIWEPCDGLGHISDVLADYGYKLRRSDIVTRGRNIEELDILQCDEQWSGDIITNPPYSHALPIIHKCINILEEGCKMAMWLRILFLESKSRKILFREYPPKHIWISSSRIECGKNGVFGNGSPQGYMWVVWEKGYKGDTIINWF